MKVFGMKLEKKHLMKKIINRKAGKGWLNGLKHNKK